MGLFDAFRTTTTAVAEPVVDIEAASLQPYNVDTAGVWFGDAPLVTRAEAMSVPTIARARGIITTAISSLPLETYNEGTKEMVPSPRVLNQPDPRIAGIAFWSWIIEDAWLHPYAYARVLERYADTGRIRAMERIAPERVYFQLNNMGTEIDAYYVDGMPIASTDLIVFNGMDEGLLSRAGRTIQAAVALERAALNFAKNPLPLTILKAIGTVFPKERIRSVVNAWRDRVDKSTAFVNGDIDVTTIGYDPKTLQMNESRQFLALELCRAANLPAYFASAEPNNFTYSNAVTERRSLVDYSLRGIMHQIEQRLSMADFTPAGYRVRYDLDDFLRGNPLEQAQVYEILNRIGAITPEEVAKEMDYIK